MLIDATARKPNRTRGKQRKAEHKPNEEFKSWSLSNRVIFQCTYIHCNENIFQSVLFMT